MDRTGLYSIHIYLVTAELDWIEFTVARIRTGLDCFKRIDVILCCEVTARVDCGFRAANHQSGRAATNCISHEKFHVSRGRWSVYQICKMCFPAIGSSLLHIVNTSLRTGIVTDSWKLSIIHPIPKAATGTSSALTNFRPISIVPIIAKIVERAVQEQLYSYFNDNHLFNASQHGFRAHHSAETALLCLTDKVYHAMDSGHVSLLVLLDLSKCFDAIMIENMILTMSRYLF